MHTKQGTWYNEAFALTEHVIVSLAACWLVLLIYVLMHMYMY